MQVEIMKRRYAADHGYRKYYTGRLCKNGHDSMRYTTTGMCVSCNAAHNRKSATALNSARQRGWVEMTVRVRKENQKTVQDFIDALNQAHELMGSPAIGRAGQPEHTIGWQEFEIDGVLHYAPPPEYGRADFIPPVPTPRVDIEAERRRIFANIMKEENRE